MGSVGNPQAWPHGNSMIRDCSQGCGIYCPQLCPPPPPTPTATAFPLQTPDPSDPSFSPLVIAIIGILAAAFLLVTYYTFASKYCATSGSSPHGRPAASPPSERAGDEADAGGGGGGGLEESLIKSMTVCRYRKGEGVMGITECSVCLSEFQQDESLRLLPKCCHAFHVRCIDTWLQTHSSCPICRVHVLPLYPLPPLAPPEVRRSNDHALVRVEEVKQGGPASSVGDGREPSRGEGEVRSERVERGEGSSMTSGGGGEKTSKKSHGRASSRMTMATDRPAPTSSVEGLSISSSRTVINNDSVGRE